MIVVEQEINGTVEQSMTPDVHATRRHTVQRICRFVHELPLEMRSISEIIGPNAACGRNQGGTGFPARRQRPDGLGSAVLPHARTVRGFR